MTSSVVSKVAGTEDTTVVVLSQTGVASAHTQGAANEETLHTVTIPGGTLGLEGAVEIIMLWSCTSSVNAKTIKVKLGTTTLFNVGMTTQTAAQLFAGIRNRGDESSQISFRNTATVFGVGTGALQIAAINTSTDTDLTITGTIANTADALVLEAITIKAVTV